MYTKLHITCMYCVLVAHFIQYSDQFHNVCWVHLITTNPLHLRPYVHKELLQFIQNTQYLHTHNTNNPLVYTYCTVFSILVYTQKNHTCTLIYILIIMYNVCTTVSLCIVTEPTTRILYMYTTVPSSPDNWYRQISTC